jgi:hypothetical protein
LSRFVWRSRLSEAIRESVRGQTAEKPIDPALPWFGIVYGIEGEKIREVVWASARPGRILSLTTAAVSKA